ncbi:unnamed protein product [Paramecium sonneborni]|uniref:D-alanyl-D-alanine dipeptidase n=1 Tax=Paramecium sonneborni TaxID=65129 RepID=A0A8S1PL51_9CILI|nr:unnamed protein product [Paramecium sonneborni]
MFLLVFLQVINSQIPEGFVRLRDIDNTILQDMRYAQYHNFVGRPIRGYLAEECILTIEAAKQLSQNQQMAMALGYRIKVWDCYRPQKAVDDFYQWSLNNDTTMQKEFYPDEQKDLLFDHGYIAKKSGHSRGSTVDLTLVPFYPNQQENYQPGDQLIPCYLNHRFKDNTIDMGTGFDCFDVKSHTYCGDLTFEQRNNRDTLLQVMLNFSNYIDEWWHFTLINEPYKTIYFDFDIQN